MLFPRAVKSNQFNSKLLPTYRPRVKKYEPVMIGGQEYVPCEETKFCTTTRLYTYKVKNIRELDGLFGDSTLFCATSLHHYGSFWAIASARKLMLINRKARSLPNVQKMVAPRQFIICSKPEICDALKQVLVQYP